MSKIAIVGVGAVGASTAYALALHEVCDEIIIYDIYPDVATGKAIDISQAVYYNQKNISIKAVKTPQEITECDIVIITAGVPRRSDMTRADLLTINATITKDVAQHIKAHSPNAIIICVSNPLDIMTYVIHRVTKWPRERIIGMGGALDSARMAYYISEHTGTDITKVDCMVIGDHGEHMLPLVQRASIDGKELSKMLTDEELASLSKKTKQGGATIVSHLGTSAYYAPARSIALMAEAILNDTNRLIPASAMLEGEYGYEDVTVGVPCKIGSKGINEIVEIDLDKSESELFAESIKSIRENVDILENSGFFQDI